MANRPCLKPGTIESLSNIIGDTNSGLTGTNIHRLLLQAHIEDFSENVQGFSKRKRLFNALVNFQNVYHCSDNILRFVQLVVDPSRFTSDKTQFNYYRDELNKVLAFEGYEILESGKFAVVNKASTITDVEIRTNNLKKELSNRKAHHEIFKYCTKELLNRDYFHAVFEANKGLFQRIRDLSGLNSDGNALIEQVFSSTPILIINSYQNQSERDEHKGFCNILKGLCGMFRNTSAHEPAISWPISEQDALEILGMISYCHRRLDNAQKIK